MSHEPRRTRWNDYGFEPSEDYEDDAISPTRSRFLARVVNSDVLPRPHLWRLRLAVAEAHGIAARMSPEDADLLALATVYVKAWESQRLRVVGVREDVTHYSPDFERTPAHLGYFGGDPFFVHRLTTEVSFLAPHDSALRRAEMTPTEPLPQANSQWNDNEVQVVTDDESVILFSDDPRAT